MRVCVTDISEKSEHDAHIPTKPRVCEPGSGQAPQIPAASVPGTRTSNRVTEVTLRMQNPKGSDTLVLDSICDLTSNRARNARLRHVLHIDALQSSNRNSGNTEQKLQRMCVVDTAPKADQVPHTPAHTSIKSPEIPHPGHKPLRAQQTSHPGQTS